MKKPHIVIDIPEYFPKEFDDLVLNGISHQKLELDFRRSEPTMYACLDWAIPGLIAAYIFKPYFESFLKEAGKDHYQLLKGKLSQLLSSAKDMKVRKVTASESTEKNNNSDSQSGAISIFLQTKDDYLIKLLYDDNLELSTWHEATSKMLELLELNYSNGETDPISQYLKNLPQNNGKELFAFIDPESKNWMMVNNLGAFDRARREEKTNANNG